MLIDLTAFAEAFSMYLCHLTAGIAADADNRFHIEDNIIREAYSNGEVFDVDLTAYHAALHKRDETNDNFTRSLRFYRQTTNSILSDEEVDFLVHQKQQEWIVENALRLSATPSVWDATRDVWVNDMHTQPDIRKSYVDPAIKAPDGVGRSDITSFHEVLRDRSLNIKTDTNVEQWIKSHQEMHEAFAATLKMPSKAALMIDEIADRGPEDGFREAAHRVIDAFFRGHKI